MPTNAQRIADQDARRARFERAAADLRRFADQRAVSEPVYPPAVRQLLTAVALACDGARRVDPRHLGQDLAAGLERIAELAPRLLEVQPPRPALRPGIVTPVPDTLADGPIA